MKETREVVVLKLDDILPNRFQPRIKFDEKAIVELSESIKEHGVIQPIIVRKISDKYEIIAGERRYKASVMAGKTTIPAIVVELDDRDSSEIALIENVQRQDLTPIEEAISYRKILDMGYITQEELATKLGVAQSTVANKLRLLNLDDDVQDALLDEKISERHARSLLKLDNKSMQKEMLERIINERLTVRKTDEEIDKMKNNMSSFDNNVNDFDNNEAQITDQTFNNNPFIINTETNTIPNNMPQNDVINDVPINVVPENIEVLDFNDFALDDINKEPENDNKIPSMPIVEDEPKEVSTSNILDKNMEMENQLKPFDAGNFAFNQNMDPDNDLPVNDNTNQNILDESANLNEENNQLNDDSEVLRPGRFFNILSTSPDDEQIDDDDKNTYQTPEIAEMPSSTDTFQFPLENNFPEGSTNDNTSLNMDSDETNTYNNNITPVTPYYEENAAEEKQDDSKQVMSLRDVINMIRDCADNIEKNNFDIDVEEFDFDDLYQVIFKIKK